MTKSAPPIMALAQFFDDIRIEHTGKSILIGQYTGDMVLMPFGIPVDRLAVLLTLRWPHDYVPQALGARIEIPGQPPLVQQFSLPSASDRSGGPPSAFAGFMMQVGMQLRFLPLRVGDAINVWGQADGHDLPAGRLSVVSPSPEQIALASAAPVTAVLAGAATPAWPPERP